jgi:PAS domain S-box-containing protein
MSPGERRPSKPMMLRKKAEKALQATRRQVQSMSPEAVQSLVHELQVHQIELEMQNEELRRAQLKLEVANDRYAILFELTGVGYVTLDERGRISEANLKFCDWVGESRRSILKRKFEEFVDPFDQAAFRLYWGGLYPNKTGSATSEVLVLRHPKTPHCVRLEYCPDAGNLLESGRHVRFVVMDVTETERLAAERDRQKALMEMTIMGVTDGIITADEEERILLFSEGAAKMFRCPESSALGQPLDRFIPGRFREDHHRHFREFARSTVSSRQMMMERDVFGVRADGEEFPAEITISKIEVMEPERTKTKTKKLFTVVMRDVTDRRKAEDALKKEKEFIATILDTSAALVVVIDPQGRIIRFNRGCEKATGFSREEVEGRFWWEKLLPPTDPEKVKEYFHALTQEQVPKFHENFWMTKEGKLRWITWLNELVRDKNGKVEFVIATGIDMTERRQSEARLTTLNTLNHAILQSTKEGIFGVDRKGHTTFFNRSAEILTGWQASEILGRCPHDFLHHTRTDGSPYPRQDCPVTWTLREGKPYFFETDLLWRKEGTSFPASYSCSPILDDAGHVDGAVVTFLDITERRQAEESLRESRKLLEYQQGELRSLAARLLHAQDEERQRISRDLHDDVNQRLALISLKVQGAQQTFEASHFIQHMLQELFEDIGTLSDDIRYLAYQYHPSSLQDLGLESTLRWLVTEVAKWENFPIQLSVRQVPRSLPLPIATCIYRVAQECLHNIAKHAGASSVICRLRGNARGLVLFIRDNGVGFEESKQGCGGMGLLSLKERVRLINGRLKIKSVTGKGTVIMVWVPWKREGE